MGKVLNGLDVLISSSEARDILKGNIAYLGNQASVSSKLENGLDVMVSLFSRRVIKAFGPQHGFVTSAQDNMIETDHGIHSVHKIPVFSLYSETRIPTDEMLDGIDTLVIDLQDVGTRVYTYIWTMYHLMEAIENKDINLIVLDRPNPVGGEKIQGNLPEKDYYSFVCRSKIPMRHGLTIGEMALWFKKFHFPEVEISVVAIYGWERKMYWRDTGHYWINPSPNLATPESSIVYPGTVLFEGTNLSEGRGTTRSLEVFGHPLIDANSINSDLQKYLIKNDVSGCVMRPVFFEPVFQKFKGELCGGFQVHPTDNKLFNPWVLGQHLLNFFYHKLNIDEFWFREPYEYEYEGLAIDWINGSSSIRQMIESKLNPDELKNIDEEAQKEFRELRNDILLY